MRREELTKLLIQPGEDREGRVDNDELLATLRNSYRFSPGFTGRVLQAIGNPAQAVRLYDLEAGMVSIFMRVALSGAAAIILLAVSVFISGGTLSFDSLLGIGNSSVESMICLLSGN
jgi:hypothetical protein